MIVPAIPSYAKSSFCHKGNCVEVAALPNGAIAVRDSKNTELPPHIFTREEWDAFIAGVKVGEFDRPTLAHV